VVQKNAKSSKLHLLQPFAITSEYLNFYLNKIIIYYLHEMVKKSFCFIMQRCCYRLMLSSCLL